jgi:hypothetical protein
MIGRHARQVGAEKPQRGVVIGGNRRQCIGGRAFAMQQTVDRLEAALEHAQTVPISRCDPQRPEIGEQARLAVDERFARRPLAHPDRLLRVPVARDDVAVMPAHRRRHGESIRFPGQRQPDPPVGRVVAQQTA